jgi:16S rRNA pseudouridine516 synthase
VRKQGIFPVGRLDKDTSGLLLLTDDGDYAHRVISPKSGVLKVYEALVDGKLTQEDVQAFADGICLKDGTHCLPARLELLASDRCLVTVQEGKYHQVRRMLASVGKTVLMLRRVSVGALSLEKESVQGTWRQLSKEEAALVFDN